LTVSLHSDKFVLKALFLTVNPCRLHEEI